MSGCISFILAIKSTIPSEEYESPESNSKWMMPVGIDGSHTQAMPDYQRPGFPLRKTPCYVRQEDESKATESSKVDAHESSCKVPASLWDRQVPIT